MAAGGELLARRGVWFAHGIRRDRLRSSFCRHGLRRDWRGRRRRLGGGNSGLLLPASAGKWSLLTISSVRPPSPPRSEAHPGGLCAPGLGRGWQLGDQLVGTVIRCSTVLSHAPMLHPAEVACKFLDDDLTPLGAQELRGVRGPGLCNILHTDFREPRGAEVPRTPHLGTSVNRSK